MSEAKEVWKNVVSSRNILLGDRTNDHICSCLQKALADLDFIAVESTRRIFEYCIHQALLQIAEGEFLSAGRVLNLIHNLPLDLEAEKTWDMDYFFAIELSTFLENFKTTVSSRNIVLFVVGQLSKRYFM